jgi:hypothetical protein
LQFPLLAVIVLIVALIAVAVFFFTRWIWNEYKEVKKADLDWREGQNKLREEAAAEQARLWRENTAEQNRMWREAVGTFSERSEQFDMQKMGMLKDISASLAKVASDLQLHDLQAKSIADAVKRVEENTRPRGQTPNT